MLAKLLYGALVSSALLSSVTALAVPADAFKCKLEVRDGRNALLSATKLEFQAARVAVPQAQVPGFQETASWADFEATLADGVRVGFDIKYSHATDSSVAYQDVCVTRSFCPPARPGDQKCMAESCPQIARPDDPNDPNPNNPYRNWTPVAINDGLPQLDLNGLISNGSEFESNRKIYRTKLECQHLGTYP